jgi:mRNA interferase MazF
LRRGELYRLRHPSGDAKRARVFVVARRDALLSSRFASVICAPVYTQRRGISTEVSVGPDEGLKHESTILCDALVSLEKSRLTDYVGTLSPAKLSELRRALRVGLDVE